MAKPIETEPTTSQEMIQKSKECFDAADGHMFVNYSVIAEVLKANYWVQRAIYEKLDAIYKK